MWSVIDQNIVMQHATVISKDVYLCVKENEPKFIGYLSVKGLCTTFYFP